MQESMNFLDFHNFPTCSISVPHRVAKNAIHRENAHAGPSSATVDITTR